MKVAVSVLSATVGIVTMISSRGCVKPPSLFTPLAGLPGGNPGRNRLRAAGRFSQ